MKTNREKCGAGGGCRKSLSLLLLPDKMIAVHEEGENGSILEIGGSTKLMRIMQEEECDSSSSSSIGNDSDDDREGDVQSRYRFGHYNNTGSFDDAVQALEEALPIRRGISTFYNGKSKSYTSLADVCSIHDVAKPEDAYTRKRRNLGAFKLSNTNNGRISKKPKITTTTLHFTLESENVVNKPLSLRSFSMVNLRRCNSSTKIGNLPKIWEDVS